MWFNGPFLCVLFLVTFWLFALQTCVHENVALLMWFTTIKPSFSVLSVWFVWNISLSSRLSVLSPSCLSRTAYYWTYMKFYFTFPKKKITIRLVRPQNIFFALPHSFWNEFMPQKCHSISKSGSLLYMVSIFHDKIGLYWNGHVTVAPQIVTKSIIVK